MGEGEGREREGVALWLFGGRFNVAFSPKT